MNKEEVREYLIAKRTPISHCVDLTKYFTGRHKTLPIFLTHAFEMEFNRSMQELEILRKQVKNQKEVIDKAIDKLYCWGEALNPEFQKEMLDILKGVE